MGRLGIALLLCILCACGAEVEQVDDSNPQPETNNDTTPTVDTLTTAVIDTVPAADTIILIDDLQGRFARFILEYGDTYTLLDREENEDGDRSKVEWIGIVSLKKNETVNYGKGKNVYPIMHIKATKFATDEAATAARERWAGGFEEASETVEIGKDVKSVKSPPMLVLFNDREQIILTYACEHAENDWEAVYDQFKRTFIRDGQSKTATLQCGGPLVWHTGL